MSSPLWILLAACVVASQFATGRPANSLTFAVSGVEASRHLSRAAQHRLLEAQNRLIVAMAGETGPLVAPPGRFSRRFRRDPLAKYRAVTGVRAKVRWWERLRSLLGLGAMILLLGAALALILLAMAMGVKVGLELIIE